MTSHPRQCKMLVLAALLAIAGSTAYADDAAPTPGAIEAAKRVIIGAQVTRSLDVVVPTMFAELEHNVLATRPELKDSLHTVTLALVPEFVKTKQSVVDSMALALAERMSEQELNDTAAFFDSPSGKKYVASEPGAFADFARVANAWRQKLAADMLTRVREQMKKKGITL